MKSPKFQLIEAPVKSAITGIGQYITFNQQPQLQSITGDKQVFIKSMTFYTSDMMAVSPLTPQNACMNAADVPGVVVNISVAGVFEFNLMPLVEFIKFINTTAPAQFNPNEFRNLYQVDWTKTQIQFMVLPTTPVPFSLLFGVVYDYTPDDYDSFSGYQSIH